MHNKPRWLWLALVGLAAIAACAAEPAPETPDAPPTEASEPTYLSDTRYLARVSMALRGTRPSLEDYRAVREDPAAVEGIVDAYLQSEQFGQAMRDLHNEALLTRAGIRPDLFGFRPTTICPAGCPEFCPPQDCKPGCPISCRLESKITPQDNVVMGVADNDLTDAVNEAPLRFIEHVIVNDLPYTDIVTADYTVANDLVAAVWGMNAYQGGGEWLPTPWTDGRPAAGILSDPALFNRHKSTENNNNRGRANVISRALLCYDFASREVEVAGVDLSDDDAVKNALTSNEACVSCHQALDPMASAFFGHVGFVVSGVTIPGYPVMQGAPSLYATTFETQWQFKTGRAPAFFGQPVSGLAQLGEQIAADSRFSLCAAKRFYAHFNRVPLDAVPLEEASELQRNFIASGYNARSLARNVVLSDSFRELSAADGSSRLKLATPEQLKRMIHDLTGLTWDAALPGGGRRDLILDAAFGFAVLAGGIDSYFTVSHAAAPNATSTLFLRALAAESASVVVDHDLSADPAARRLLGIVHAQESAPDAIRAQLVDVHLRLFGEDADDDELAAAAQLFDAVFARTGDVSHAWKTTLTAMLQDPSVTFY